jgi:tetratricopeptide (TPR) repeat protein
VTTAAKNPRALLAAAVARHQAGDLKEAERLYREILDADPRHADSLHLLGVVANQNGAPEEAVKLISQAIAQNGRAPQFHNNIGAAYRALGEIDKAVTHYRRAVALKPDYAEAHNNLAGVLEETGHADEAMVACKRALALKPDYAKAYYVMGNILLRLDRLDEAAANLQRALQFTPLYAEAENNLGNVRRAQGRFDDAVQCFHRALALKPGYAPAHYNIGLTREEEGRFDEALAAYERATAIAPDYADAHWNEALVRLLRGEYPLGWRKYEWRWRRPGVTARTFAQPRWDGGDLSGRSILVHAEQGFGDTIQFVRYARLLAQRGARVIVECPASLTSLVATSPGVAEVIATGAPLPAFDCHAPLLSMPYHFGTTVDTIPAPVPYLFPPADLRGHWRAKISQTPGRNIGLVWRGNAANTINAKKSLPIDLAAQICGAAGINWISLQADATPAEIETISRAAPIQNLGPTFRDWADTAALISELDLVISIDTGVAHLAGALAKPVWVLLAAIPDWRWLLERRDSPWYPTARLFRQPQAWDWDAATADVRHALIHTL